MAVRLPRGFQTRFIFINQTKKRCESNKVLLTTLQSKKLLWSKNTVFVKNLQRLKRTRVCQLLFLVFRSSWRWFRHCKMRGITVNAVIFSFISKSFSAQNSLTRKIAIISLWYVITYRNLHRYVFFWNFRHTFIVISCWNSVSIIPI